MSLLLLNNKGEKVDFEEKVLSLYSQEELANGLLTSDMDGTMYEQDLGILVFLQKLGDSTFWTFDLNRFRGLLLPKDYFVTLQAGAEGVFDSFEGMDAAKCRMILDLKEDICLLYRAIKLAKIRQEELDLSHPLVNEFAYKMVLMDGLVISMEPYMGKHFKLAYLMRTRFFASKNFERVRSLVLGAMDRTEDDNILLQSYDVNQDSLGGRLKVVNEPPVEIDRDIRVVQKVQELTRILVEDCGVLGTVVTTNLYKIADTFIRGGVYKDLIERIVGTRLKMVRGGCLNSLIEGRPVIGLRKAEVAEELAQLYRKKHLFAAGDSNGDFHMAEKVLREGGVFVGVGKSVDSITKTFNGRLLEAVGQEAMDERFLCATY
ncbi:hypothetical protein KJ632_01380 [Patescibacteria group bacterium]|nr:hypothetical protein [Patescibacteria group bacterium]